MMLKSDSTTEADCRFDRPWAATALIKSFLVSAFTSPQPQPVLEPMDHVPRSLGGSFTEKAGMTAGLQFIPGCGGTRPIRVGTGPHHVVGGTRRHVGCRAIFASRDAGHLHRKALSSEARRQP